MPYQKRARIIAAIQAVVTTAAVLIAVYFDPVRMNLYLTAYGLALTCMGIGVALTFVNVPHGKKNKKTIVFGVAFIAYSMLVAAPITEETIFRAPLMAMFPTMQGRDAWIGVVIASVLFGIIHYPGIYGPGSKVGYAKDRDPDATRPQRLKRVAYQMLDVVQSFTVGLILGYVVIYQQSLWLAMALHAAANVIIPILSVSVTATRILLERRRAGAGT